MIAGEQAPAAPQIVGERVERERTEHESEHGRVAAAMMMVTGALMTAEKVVVSTLRQQIVPDELLGRAHSSSRLVVMVGGPVGAALGGVLARVFAVQVSYAAAGAFLVLVALLFYPVLNNRALARATDESAGQT